MQPWFRIASRLTACLPLAGMVAACDDPVYRVETGGTAVSSTTFVPTDTTLGPTAAAELSDANIVALLDRASVADSAAGAVASAKATSADVEHFARAMMAEHHGLRMQAAALEKKLGITAQPPAYDPVTPRALEAMDALESAPKGPGFDRTYIQQEIAAHREMLDLADQAHDAAGSPALRAMIERARPLIRQHLEQALAIERALGDTA